MRNRSLPKMELNFEGFSVLGFVIKIAQSTVLVYYYYTIYQMTVIVKMSNAVEGGRLGISSFSWG